MSKQEFSRLEVLLRVQSGRLRVADACELIGLQRRQVFRLLRGLKQARPNIHVTARKVASQLEFSLFGQQLVLKRINELYAAGRHPVQLGHAIKARIRGCPSRGATSVLSV